MMSDVQPRPIDTTVEGFDALAALQLRCNPNLPLASGQELHWAWSRLQQLEPKGLWGVYDQGELIAAVSGCPEWWRTPAESVVMTLDVHPKWRGRGIGSALIEHVACRYRDAGPHAISTMIVSRKQGDDAFWLARGFRSEGCFHQSGYDLTQPLNASHLQRSMQLKKDGFEFVDGDAFRRRFVDDWQQRWWRVWSNAEQDMPGPAPPQPRPFEVFVKLLERPGLDLSLCHFCLYEHQLTGFTSLIPYGLSPQFAAIWMTGVARDFRRKGIATGVKVASIDAAKRRGLSWIITENEQTNPTHTLNVALGFVHRYDRVWMLKDTSAAGMRSS